MLLTMLGGNVEDYIGHERLAMFHLLCAATAGLAAYYVLHPRVKAVALLFRLVPLPHPACLLIGGWLLVQHVSVWSSGSPPLAC